MAPPVQTERIIFQCFHSYQASRVNDVPAKCKTGTHYVCLRRAAFSPLVLLFLSLVTLVSLVPPVAAAPRVQVRGNSRLEVRASGPRDRIQVSGTLRDETGSPVPDALVVLTPMADSTMDIPWKTVGSCSGEGGAGAGTVEHAVVTDSMGGFCVVGSLARGEALVRLVYAGGPLHEGTRSEVLWNAQQQPLTVSFAPRPERVDLDGQRVVIFARATTPPGVSSQGLTLVLTEDEGRALATTMTDEAGAAHFDFASSAMQGPGIGTLHVTFPGREDLATTSASATVTRTARVRLAAQQQEVRGDPSRGLVVRVQALTSRGPASSGTIEASLDHDVVGTGHVADGWADVVMTFRPRRDTGSHGVTLRYRPDAPYFEQAGSISVAVIAVQPSLWLRAVPLVLAALVGTWLLRGWWRPKRRERQAMARPSVKGVSSLEIVRPLNTRDRWTGKVVDAHDESPIAHARVRVVVPTFLELDVVVDERTNARGIFEFVLRTAEKDLRLRVESEFHGEIDRPLPPASEMVVALVSRRRLLLDRLVRWARRSGKPWHQQPDPTPGHVARVARGQRGDAVARWAERVEAGAYGPDPVDYRSEKEVRDMEPRGQPLR